MEESLPLYVQARRDFLRLWRAKQSLFLKAQSRFPKTYPVFKAIERLCHNDPTCEIRLQADRATCQCADKYGDDLFRNKVVDDVRIPAVTHWFYGISDLLPSAGQLRLDRTKTFTMQDICLFDQLKASAEAFAKSASALPYVSKSTVQRERKKYERLIAKADEHLQKASPAYVSYLMLLAHLPHEIAKNIVCFNE